MRCIATRVFVRFMALKKGSRGAKEYLEKWLPHSTRIDCIVRALKDILLTLTSGRVAAAHGR
jgi:hypothetical protein